jgi:hypothetical protein
VALGLALDERGLLVPDVLWTNNSTTYDAQELRRADAMLVMGNGSARGGRSGIRPGAGGYGVSVSGTTITVTTGVMTVAGPTGEGMYRCPLATDATLTLTAAHATLPRIDLVYLRVWDSDLDGTGLYKFEPVYLAGTAAASPVAPTIPGGQTGIEVATISVPASGGGSPSVSQTIRPYTVAPGGILPASTAPSSPYTGQFYDDGTYLYRYSGSAWRIASPLLPTVSDQVSSPGTYTVSGFTDFTSGQWPPITVTVPQSGIVAISIGAAVRNTNTATSTGWAAFRLSGATTEVGSEKTAVSCAGSRTYATRRVFRSGLTPGASLTVTPQYQFSSVNASSTVTGVDNGQLSVEPIPG